MRNPRNPEDPTRGPADELAHCFIVRITDQMRQRIEAHRRWMRAHYQLPRVSLASASRDLFLRGLYLSPRERQTKREMAALRQLNLFDNPADWGHRRTRLGRPCA